MRAFVEELIGAYGSFYRLAQRSLAAASIFPLDRSFEMYSLTRRLFHRDSATYRLMVESTSRVMFSPTVLPLYMNILIWTLDRKTVEEVRLFWAYVATLMKEGGLDTGGSAEVLYWILITDVERQYVADPPLVHLLARLLRVVNWLTDALKEKLVEQLLFFLSGSADEAYRFRWSPDQFRSDVLDDLGMQDEGGWVQN
jgi:hypothetical protein